MSYSIRLLEFILLFYHFLEIPDITDLVSSKLWILFFILLLFLFMDKVVVEFFDGIVDWLALKLTLFVSVEVFVWGIEALVKLMRHVSPGGFVKWVNFVGLEV